MHKYVFLITPTKTSGGLFIVTTLISLYLPYKFATMPIPLAALAAISAAPAIAQGITGFVQSRKSKNILDDLERPTYDIPLAATQALQQARSNASSFQMAGQTQANQALDQTAANALYSINQNATSAPEALAAMSGVYANQMGAQNNLAGQAATDYANRQQRLSTALNTYGGYQDKAWDYNVNQPFEQKAAEAQALGNAGMNNKYQAFKGLAGVGANMLASPDFKGLFGTGDKTTGFTPAKVKSTEEFGAGLGAFTGVPNLNPNVAGYNQYGQPQFKSVVDRISSFNPSMEAPQFKTSAMSNAGTTTFTPDNNSFSQEQLESIAGLLKQFDFGKIKQALN